MYFRELKQAIPALLDAAQPVYLEGPPGIGKSAFWRGITAELGIGYHTFDASSIDPAEPQGFVAPSTDADGDAVATYLRSALMPSKQYLAANPRGILVIDELPATIRAVRHALDPVIHERRFGPVSLPSGWLVVAQGNRTADKSGAQVIEAKTRNRAASISMEWSAEHWAADIAAGLGLPAICIAFARANPKVFADAVPAEPVPFCTARSFTNASRFWGYASACGVPRNVALEVVSGNIGHGACGEFSVYAEYHTELPTEQEIRDTPKQAKVPARLDLAYAAMITATRAAESSGNLAAVWQYVERLPAEYIPVSIMNWANNPKLRKQLTTVPALTAKLAKIAPDLVEIMSIRQ